MYRARIIYPGGGVSPGPMLRHCFAIAYLSSVVVVRSRLWQHRVSVSTWIREPQDGGLGGQKVVGSRDFASGKGMVGQERVFVCSCSPMGMAISGLQGASEFFFLHQLDGWRHWIGGGRVVLPWLRTSPAVAALPPWSWCAACVTGRPFQSCTACPGRAFESRV